MKIAIISTFIGQKVSGAEISSFLLSRNLSKEQDVFIITTKITKKMPSKAYSLPFTRFIPNLILLIGHKLIDKYTSKKIYEILQKEKPDVVHIQDSSIMIASINAAKKLKIPIVFTIRDYRFICNLAICLEDNGIEFNCDKKQYKKCLYESFRRAYNLRNIGYLVFPWFYKQKNRLVEYFKKIDYYISVSDYIRRQAIKAGIKKDKIKTIKVQKEEWEPIELKTNQEEVTIFSAGGLKGVKGFDFLIKSFKTVLDKYPNAVLRIAGGGSAKNKLIGLAKKLKIINNVVFLGQISHENMRKEYANSAFVVSPSVWPEPLSRIIFEAFTMKKTVVATNVGGSSELVKHNKTGLLVKAGDVRKMANAIIKLIENVELRKIMALKAHDLINKECNGKINYKQHMGVYNSVIKRAGKARKGI
ncbi:glycosyltransferase family 4 protein [Candidatus Woesearchaeota archaeon]|nr:glycosyltransferase family 4 protein [Candidatus Woesearchaeota archaeon]